MAKGHLVGKVFFFGRGRPIVFFFKYIFLPVHFLIPPACLPACLQRAMLPLLWPPFLINMYHVALRSSTFLLVVALFHRYARRALGHTRQLLLAVTVFSLLYVCASVKLRACALACVCVCLLCRCGDCLFFNFFCLLLLRI